MKQVKEGKPEEQMPSWFVLVELVLISRQQVLPNVFWFFFKQITGLP